MRRDWINFCAVIAIRREQDLSEDNEFFGMHPPGNASFREDFFVIQFSYAMEFRYFNSDRRMAYNFPVGPWLFGSESSFLE